MAFTCAPALSMCIFLPVGLYVFFTTVPQERQGVQLGLAMAAGELVWLAVLPLLHLLLQGLDAPEPVLYIYKLLGFVMAGIGVCFAVAVMDIPPLRISGHPSGDYSGSYSDNMSEAAIVEAPNEKATPLGHGAKALPLLFGAGVFFYLLFGVALLGLPRASEYFHLSGIAPLLLTIVGPLAGIFLDRALNTPDERLRNRRMFQYFLIMLGGAILAIPLWAVVAGFEFQAGLPVLLLAIRQVMFLTILVLTARLAGGSAFFPLLACFTWGLMLFHLPGIQAGTFFLAHSPARLALTATLAAGAVLFLWRAATALNRHLALTPPLLSVSPAVVPQHATDEVAAKLLAFSAAFALTKREHQILEGFIRRIPQDTLSEKLGISESTIRFHQTGLLRKTPASSKRRLLQFFTEWEPGDTAGSGKPGKEINPGPA